MHRRPTTSRPRAATAPADQPFRRSPARRQAARAFTLIELMIVVVILAIAATMAAPLFGETSGTTVRAAARLLIDDLQYAQMQAMAHPDAPYGLRFDSASSSYAVVQDSGGGAFDCAGAAIVTNAVDNQPFVTQFGGSRAMGLAGVGIDSYALGGDDCLAFGAFGQTDQTAAATVTLTAGSSTITITIDPTNGESTASP